MQGRLVVIKSFLKDHHPCTILGFAIVLFRDHEKLRNKILISFWDKRKLMRGTRVVWYKKPDWTGLLFFSGKTQKVLEQLASYDCKISCKCSNQRFYIILFACYYSCSLKRGFVEITTRPNKFLFLAWDGKRLFHNWINLPDISQLRTLKNMFYCNFAFMQSIFDNSYS